MTALLAIDQGTTSTRAIVFDARGTKRGVAQRELPQSYPRAPAGAAGGAAQVRVEHDARRIWSDTVAVVKGALKQSRTSAAKVAAIGITNQRETTIVWERATGKPIHPAIVWQDRRTADFCASHASAAVEEMIGARTGLLLDPYFSATKIRWLLDHVRGARERAERGELAFGTVDSWLLWNLTGGKVHATDASNAARTMLYDIRAQRWDDELLRLFGVPRAMLPQVMDCAAEFGVTDRKLFGAEIPIRGMAGDQQAATFGQACFAPGMIKSTYGTGCFVVLNTGEQFVRSKHRL
ncbi:MAG TPA: FGGY family carbohydrate kinase, partial [Candidatus Binatia bacterium]|nr:FGGY family carbohydrate kinase [Candidatus Binatia bacterium]